MPLRRSAHGHRHRRQRSRYQPHDSGAAWAGGGRLAHAGYTGADKRPEHEDRDVSWNIAIKRSIIKALSKGLRDLAEPVERALSQVRAWVEHPFRVLKNLFRHKKLRYRGLAKNTAQLHILFALANLVIVKKTLLAQPRSRGRPDPANSTGNPASTANFCSLRESISGPPSEIVPRLPNAQPPQQCSAFP